MLQFCNNYPADVWVCILWYHPGCPDGGDWEKAGWWHLAPGECKVVFGDDLEDINRYWYFHGDAADGAFWAGAPTIFVPFEAFDWCVDTASTDGFTVGLRELDVDGNDDMTVNLVP
jgi:uncharacterized membrane protein